jgi:predicted porin
MKRIVVSLAALMASSAAFAADLPTKKGAPVVPEKPNCFASLYSYFDSSPTDCPLSYWGLTFYATVDLGVGYASHGAPFNGKFPTGTDEFVQKFGNKGQFLFTPNGLSQSQIGLKAKEPLGYGFSFVGEVAAGFDPYSLRLTNGPGSMVENTALPLNLQSTNGDSSRAGQFDNSVGYAGFSHDLYGTLTAGRQNSLTLEGVNAYDPMGGSYAFSPIGWSGKVAGAGSTEDARVNTAVKYAGKWSNFRVSGLIQFGGYTYGNGSNGEIEVGAGGDFNVFGGALSVDGIYTHIKDQVNLGTYNGVVVGGLPTIGLPAGVPGGSLKATLSNNDSFMGLAKYKWNQFTVYGGYEHIHYGAPSDNYANGFTTIGDYNVPSTALGGVNSTAYTAAPLNFDVLWTGAKYAINDRLDITGAYYLYIQNNYTTGGKSCAPNTVPAVAGGGYSPQGTATSTCQGYMNAVSGMIDWRPLKRVDVYAGVMFSKVSGGLATGYLYNSDIAPTAGIRVRF